MNASLKVIRRVFKPGSINEEKAIINASHDIVTGGSLFAGYDGDVFVCQTVKQAGFTGVSLTNKRNNGKLFHEIILTQNTE